MSIFTRSNPQQVSTAPSPEHPADGGVPGAAAGVLPPPTAPAYSVRAEPAPAAPAESSSSLADKVRMARQQQQAVGERVRAGVQRAKGLTATQPPRQQAAATATATMSRSSSMRYPFDPVTCAQTGLLSLAWRWQEAGAPIRAIHTYIELLTRYPDTAAAAAAVSDLVELSEKLADQGQFHIALAIYDHLEYLA
jgi:hypothetical protein